MTSNIETPELSAKLDRYGMDPNWSGDAPELLPCPCGYCGGNLNEGTHCGLPSPKTEPTDGAPHTIGDLVKAHLDISTNHEAGLIPMATRTLLRELVALSDARKAANIEHGYHANHGDAGIMIN